MGAGLVCSRSPLTGAPARPTQHRAVNLTNFLLGLVRPRAPTRPSQASPLQRSFADNALFDMNVIPLVSAETQQTGRACSRRRRAARRSLTASMCRTTGPRGNLLRRRARRGSQNELARSDVECVRVCMCVWSPLATDARCVIEPANPALLTTRARKATNDG
jgi:hypothetical protein